MPEATGAAHIVLVGMMGSGKSTVGRRVARKLDVNIVDTDDELVAKSGRGIAEWFSEVGEEAFRDAEERVLADVLATPETVVVATGGGIVEREANRALLREGRSTVIWLRGTPDFLASRIAQKGEQANRPLLADDPLAALIALDERRRDLYADVADIIVDIEPIMNDADHPRKALAEVVIETLARTGVQVMR